MFAALVAVGYFFARNWQTFQSGSGTPNANVVEPAYTLEDITRIAAGEKPNSALASALLDTTAPSASFLKQRPGDAVLTASFVEGIGLRRETHTFGWPDKWVTQINFSLYKDAVARTGRQAMRTRTPSDHSNIIMPQGQMVAANAMLDESGLVWPRPRWSWGTYGGGYLAYRPTPEETAGDVLWIDINTYGVVAVLGLIVLGWALPRIVIWMLNVLRGRSRPRWRSDLASWTGALLVAASIAWLTIDSAAHSDSFVAPMRRTSFVPTGATGGFHTQQGMEHSSLRLSQLPALAANPDGDRIAAQAILAALNEKPSATHYLAIAITPEAIMHNGRTTFHRALPILSLHSTQYMRRSDIGAPDLLANPAGVTWDFQYSSLHRRVSTGDPTKAETSITVNLGAVGTLVLGAWLLWLIATFVCRFITMLIVRRRRRRSECIACGYALGPPGAVERK